ncbi:hypothetical protein LP7551_04458 [Roseibium album]|nr:hypothetical protein LP7551_04458 [Roseibium album]
MTNRFLCVAAAFAFGLSLTSPSLAASVSPDEVIGKTWFFQQGGAEGKVTYNRTSVKVRSGGKTFNGTLRVSGNKICTKYKTLRNGKESCFTVSKTKTGYKTSSGGKLWR